MHSVPAPGPVTLPNQTPGSTVTFEVTVSNAVQPATSIAASVDVSFLGESVVVPLAVNFAGGPILPTATVDLGGATNLSVSVGTAQPTAVTNRYVIPITLTVI